MMKAAPRHSQALKQGEGLIEVTQKPGEICNRATKQWSRL